MTDELRIKATKILMKSDLTVDKIADIHEAMCQDGAIEFLRKAKAICESFPLSDDMCDECFMKDFCKYEIGEIENEADLVRKVMEYRLEGNNDKNHEGTLL